MTFYEVVFQKYQSKFPDKMTISKEGIVFHDIPHFSEWWYEQEEVHVRRKD